MDPCDEKYPVSWISCNSRNIFPLGNISMVTEITFAPCRAVTLWGRCGRWCYGTFTISHAQDNKFTAHKFTLFSTCTSLAAAALLRLTLLVLSFICRESLYSLDAADAKMRKISCRCFSVTFRNTRIRETLTFITPPLV